MLATKRPISFYFLIIIGILALAFFLKGEINIAASIFYFLLIDGVFYYGFCRYACTVTIKNNMLIIDYLFPWYKNIRIDLQKVQEFYYRKGFYGIFSDNSVIIGGINFCFDTIVIKMLVTDQICEKTIKINTRFFSFNKVIDEFKRRGIKPSRESFKNAI